MADVSTSVLFQLIVQIPVCMVWLPKKICQNRQDTQFFIIRNNAAIYTNMHFTRVFLFLWKSTTRRGIAGSKGICIFNFNRCCQIGFWHFTSLPAVHISIVLDISLLLMYKILNFYLNNLQMFNSLKEWSLIILLPLNTV